MLEYSWRPIHWCINYYCRTDIDEARVMSALRHKPKFNPFWKEIQFLGFPCCSTHKDLSVDVSITTVGLILTKLGWFLLSGYRQTDGQPNRQDFGILIWKQVGTQKKKKINSKLKIKSKLSIAICIPGGRGCIISLYSAGNCWIPPQKDLKGVVGNPQQHRNGSVDGQSRGTHYCHTPGSTRRPTN